MAKIDKSLYTKQQIKALLAERKRQKAAEVYTTDQKQLKTLDEHTRKQYGFVLGNGTSRKGIDPADLQQYGKIYGCNALYREFDPDYLIAVDVKMILEITKKEYQLKNLNVWTNQNKAYKHIQGLNYFKPSKGWSSGPTALHLATQHMPGYKKIFILGFDYAGLGENRYVNNVYAGTPNYKKTTDSATYYGNWLKQTATVIRDNPQITFYRVIQLDNIIPKELNKFSNLKHIYVEDFQKMFNLS
jgi:hypothetical protein